MCKHENIFTKKVAKLHSRNSHKFLYAFAALSHFPPTLIESLSIPYGSRSIEYLQISSAKIFFTVRLRAGVANRAPKDTIAFHVGAFCLRVTGQQTSSKSSGALASKKHVHSTTNALQSWPIGLRIRPHSSNRTIFAILPFLVARTSLFRASVHMYIAYLYHTGCNYFTLITCPEKLHEPDFPNKYKVTDNGSRPSTL